MIIFSLVGLLGIGLTHNIYIMMICYIIGVSLLALLNVYNRTNWHEQAPNNKRGFIFNTRRAYSSMLGLVGYAITPIIILSLQKAELKLSIIYQYLFIGSGISLLFITIIMMSYIHKVLHNKVD